MSRPPAEEAEAWLVEGGGEGEGRHLRSRLLARLHLHLGCNVWSGRGPRVGEGLPGHPEPEPERALAWTVS